MNRNKQYSVRLIEVKNGRFQSYSPSTGEWCDDLAEAREHGQIADVAIFAPGKLAGRDEPTETWIDGRRAA